MQLSVQISSNVGVGEEKEEIKSEKVKRACLLDKVQCWLESGDSTGEKAIAYGICCFTILYLAACPLRMLIGF